MRKFYLCAMALIGWAITHSANAQDWNSLQVDLKKDAVAGSNKFSKANTPLMVIDGHQNFAAAKTIEQWKKLRRSGIILTSFGAACVTAGAIMVSQADELYYNVSTGSYGTVEEGDPLGGFGIAGIAGGITALGGGITMWLIGNNRIKKYGQNISLTNGKRSIGIAYHF